VPILGRTFTGISYSENITRGEVRAGGPLPIGYTRGEYKAEGSLEMPKEEFELFLAGILAASPALGRFDVVFELSVSYQELGGPLIVDDLNGCRLNGTEQSYQRGPEGLLVKVPLHVHALILNGSTPFSADVMIR
jgi:hypothetical protein